MKLSEYDEYLSDLGSEMRACLDTITSNASRVSAIDGMIPDMTDKTARGCVVEYLNKLETVASHVFSTITPYHDYRATYTCQRLFDIKSQEVAEYIAGAILDIMNQSFMSSAQPYVRIITIISSMIICTYNARNTVAMPITTAIPTNLLPLFTQNMVSAVQNKNMVALENPDKPQTKNIQDAIQYYLWLAGLVNITVDAAMLQSAQSIDAIDMIYKMSFQVAK